MNLAKSGMLVVVLVVGLVGCATGRASNPPLCPHALYMQDMMPSWEYYRSLEAAFQFNEEGHCTLKDEQGYDNCLAFERLNELERYCYQINKARD